LKISVVHIFSFEKKNSIYLLETLSLTFAGGQHINKFK